MPFVVIVPGARLSASDLLKSVARDWVNNMHGLPNFGVAETNYMLYGWQGHVVLLEGDGVAGQGLLIYGLLPWDVETSQERANVLVALLCARLKAEKAELLVAGAKFTIAAKQ